MTRAEMLAELQTVLNDATTGGAWSTTTLLGYLAEGQDKFCEETGTITLYPVPTAADNGDVYALQVWRYSRYDLAGDGAAPEGGGDAPDAEPEIPSRFHRACVEWAAYKAFMHRDVETQDSIKAADHLNAFKMYVSDGVTTLRRYQNQEVRVGTNPAYRT